MDPIATQLIKILTHDILRRSRTPIDLDTPLVSSGLLDSFHLIDVILAVEDLTGVVIPSDQIQAQDLETVRQILALVEKFR